VAVGHGHAEDLRERLPDAAGGKSSFLSRRVSTRCTCTPRISFRSGSVRRITPRSSTPVSSSNWEYKAPLFTCSRGSLGPPPQRYNGMAVIIGVMAAAVLLIFAMAAIVAVAA
jgi:hypothetical protein